MNLTFFIVLGLAFLCFIIPAATFATISKRGVFGGRGFFASAFFMPAATLLATTVAAWFLFYDPGNFIGSFGLPQIVVPFAGAFLICFAGRMEKPARWRPLIVPLAAVAAVMVIPADSILVFPSLSPFVNRLIIALCWGCFALLYRYTNSGDGVLCVQALGLSAGIGILGTISALPLLLGIYGWLFMAALLALTAFSWHPSRIKISAGDAAAWGFLLFFLVAPAAGEGAVSCCLILSMFLLVDFIWALALKLTFLPRYDNLVANSGCQKAIEIGMEPEQAASFLVRIEMLMLLFGCFQAYSPTPWSLLLVSLFIALWLDYRLRTTPGQRETLKDINARVLEELQDRVDEFKSYIKKDDNL